MSNKHVSQAIRLANMRYQQNLALLQDPALYELLGKAFEIDSSLNSARFMRPLIKELGLSGLKMWKCHPLLGSITCEIFKCIASYLDFESVLRLPLISKDFYWFCIDDWLIPYLAWGNPGRRLNPAACENSSLSSSRIVAHRVQSLPKGLSIIVFAEQSNQQINFKNVLSMSIRHHDSEEQSKLKYSNRQFIINFLANDFQNLKYLFLDSVPLNPEVSSALNDFHLKLLHLHNCSADVSMSKRRKSLSQLKVETLFITIREIPDMIEVPYGLQELSIRYSGGNPPENPSDAPICEIFARLCENLRFM
jgi:hypothetical protein